MRPDASADMPIEVVVLMLVVDDNETVRDAKVEAIARE